MYYVIFLEDKVYITRNFMFIFIMTISAQQASCTGAANADISMQSNVQYQPLAQSDEDSSLESMQIQTQNIESKNQEYFNDEDFGEFVSYEDATEDTHLLKSQHGNLNEDDGVLMPYEETPAFEYDGTLYKFIQEHGDSM